MLQSVWEVWATGTMNFIFFIMSPEGGVALWSVVALWAASVGVGLIRNVRRW